MIKTKQGHAKEFLIVSGTFIFLALIYWIFRSRVIGYGDALGFYIKAADSFTLKTTVLAHFLYLNLLSLFMRASLLCSSFDLAVIFSIVFSLATLYQLYRIVKLQTDNLYASLTVVIMLGLSFTYWRQTEIIEVYPFNNFLFISLLWYVLKDIKTDSNKSVYIVSILLGLCLLAHIQNILLFPFFLLYLFFSCRKNYKKMALAVAITLGISSILILIPLIWETNTLLSVLFHNEHFKEKSLSLDKYIVLNGIVKSIGYFFYNFLMASFFILHGLYVLYKKDKKLSILFALVYLPFWAFACRYDVPDNYVFFLTPYIVLAIISGYSFDHWMKRRSYSFLWIPAMAIGIPLTYFLVWQLSLKIPQLNSLDHAKAYKGGLKYLLWPGMKNNGGDLLKQSKEIYLSGDKPASFHEFEWNYDTAIKYLKQKGELK